jgi:hypothetical protein
VIPSLVKSTVEAFEGNSGVVRVGGIPVRVTGKINGNGYY